MAKEKNLTTVTSIAAADFARLVTSAGASVKATAANLAKYIIETYNGSTVAGSAQSVKSALDSLNRKTPVVITVNSGSSKLFTLTNNTRAMLFFSSTFEGGTGIVNIACSSGGVADAIKVSGVSNVTITKSGNTVTLNSTYNSYIMIVTINGTVTAS